MSMNYPFFIINKKVFLRMKLMRNKKNPQKLYCKICQFFFCTVSPAALLGKQQKKFKKFYIN